MKKTLLLSCLLVTGYVFAQDCEAYFPMKEGAEFEITNYDKKDKLTGKVKHSVLSYDDLGSGNITCTVQQESFDKKDELIYTNEYTAQCVDGIFAFDMSVFMDSEQMATYENMDVEVDASDLEMPTDPVAGQELNDGSLTVKIGSEGVNMFTLTVNVTNRKVDAIEEVTTDAGTFECVKISYDVETKLMFKITGSAIEWYAKDVGVVKSESYDKKGNLTGYSMLTSLSE